MILNQSADYALRAVLFLARSDEQGPLNADVVAGALGVPRNYLGKVLNQLVQYDVLVSERGPRGGFSLAAPAREIVLKSVIAPFQEMPRRNVCLLGNRPCNAARPCDAHERWRRMSDPVSKFFTETTIEDMIAEA